MISFLMKKCVIACFWFVVMSQISCKGGSTQIDFDTSYIDTVEVLTPFAQKVQIDNFAHTITIDFSAGADVTNCQLKLTLSPAVSMQDPSQPQFTCNLTKTVSVKLMKDKQLITFYVKANFVSSSFNPSAKGWVKNTDFVDLPSSISIYKYGSTYDNKNVQAYIAVAKVSDIRFSVLGQAQGVSTPTQFYTSNGQPKIVLNAGFFWSGNALGLVVRDGKTIKAAQPVAWRAFNGTSTAYYPTQGAFGVTSSGTYAAHWAYEYNGTLYSYPTPSPNVAGEKPQSIPTDKFPSGATAWTPKDAVGAGPVLIKNGEYKNLWSSELLDDVGGIGPTSNNPRSAVGYHPSGYLIFFVCEGRNKTPDTPGLTLKNEADLLLALGCTEAINLDGGGSSCMLVNGKETIKPSDGQQRAVSSVIALY